MRIFVGRCAILIVLCAAGCTPAGSTRTLPPAPATPEPGVQPVSTGPWRFSYAPGTHGYVVRSNATIEAVESGALDSVQSVAHLTYELIPAGEELLISGTIDSFTVNVGDSVPQPMHVLSFPIVFSGRMDEAGQILEFTSPDTSTCGSAAGALLGIARELLVAVPEQLTVGETWQDSTSTTSCRGDIPMTVSTTRHYQVEEQVDSSGIAVLRITRRSDLAMHGTGTRPIQATTVNGTGTGMMELFLDPLTGTFDHAAGESLTTLTFDAASRRETFLQRVRLTIERLASPN